LSLIGLELSLIEQGLGSLLIWIRTGDVNPWAAPKFKDITSFQCFGLTTMMSIAESLVHSKLSEYGVDFNAKIAMSLSRIY